MLTNDLTNSRKVWPDKDGPALTNRLAAEIAAIDQFADCPHDPREARALLEKLQAQMVRVPRGESLRAAQYNEAYNGALRDVARAKRAGLYSRDFMLPPAPANVTPNVLGELNHLIAEMGEKLEAFEARQFPVQHGTDPTISEVQRKAISAAQLRIIDLEWHNKSLEAKLRQVVEHSNKLVDAIRNLEDKLAALSPHPDLIERERDGP
jgi:hypothetical protein